MKSEWKIHPEQLEELFYDVYGYKDKINYKFELRICADSDIDLEFLEKAKEFKFPSYK